MADMAGHGDHSGHANMGHGSMDHGNMDHGKMDHGSATHKMPDGTVMKGAKHMDHAGHGGATHTMPDGTVMTGAKHMDHGKMGHAGHGGMDHSAHGAMAEKQDPFYAPGSGLMPRAAKKGGKFLSYADLKAFRPLYPHREADRVIEVRLTGNMERYIWSINGVKFSDAEPSG